MLGKLSARLVVGPAVGVPYLVDGYKLGACFAENPGGFEAYFLCYLPVALSLGHSVLEGFEDTFSRGFSDTSVSLAQIKVFEVVEVLGGWPGFGVKSEGVIFREEVFISFYRVFCPLSHNRWEDTDEVGWDVWGDLVEKFADCLFLGYFPF